VLHWWQLQQVQEVQLTAEKDGMLGQGWAFHLLWLAYNVSPFMPFGVRPMSREFSGNFLQIDQALGHPLDVHAHDAL